MDFESRLEKAIARGQRRGEAEAQAAARQALNEEELRRLHTQYRLELSEHIESCLRQLADHFPGFRFELVTGDRGWGAAVNRDDLRLSEGSRRSVFSRLEMAIRPFSAAHVLDLTARGTVANKELFERSHYQRLTEADSAGFRELIDLWTLEYAEQYAARA